MEIDELLQRICTHNVAVEHENIIYVLEVVLRKSNGPCCTQCFVLLGADYLNAVFLFKLLQPLGDFVGLVIDGQDDLLDSHLG